MVLALVPSSPGHGGKADPAQKGGQEIRPEAAPSLGVELPGGGRTQQLKPSRQILP